jgi:hypothetical protein
VDSIYKFRDQYWCHSDRDEYCCRSDEELFGPYATFADAMEMTDLRIIDATQSIWCSELAQPS